MKTPPLSEMKRVDVMSAIPMYAKYVTTIFQDDTLFIKDLMIDIWVWDNNKTLKYYCYYHF